TAIQAYYANRSTDTAVAVLPRQYAGNPERMRIEAWESGYHLVQISQWEDEPIPWQDLVIKMDQQAKPLNAKLVFVGTEFTRKQSRQETVTIYRTENGRSTSVTPGEAYRSETQKSVSRYDVYTYNAYFFSKQIQPSGILAEEAPWDGPCRAANTYGAQVIALAKGSPAQQAGFQNGDVILKINGQTASADSIYFLFTPGSNQIEACRKGEPFSKTLQLPASAQSPQGNR
ncbi:PDZ domain-containing protein, partial [Desulfovibrio sp. OttesenSCG-928-C06]|nr:PDZ domain-containing protein [Desulfovibrio sp. OttesenSCG-928-C06]